MDADNEEPPFRGVTVLDVSQGFAGPSCAGMLALQGATVVKVEPPEGDWARHIGARYGDNTAFGLVPNQGKRSICIDAAKPEGRALLRRLALGADVLVQNFRAGVAERLGIGAEALRAEKPELIHVTITGFGTTGDWARRPATDTILQGYTGLMTLVGGAGNPPRRVDFSLIDVVAGVQAAQRVAAALYRRATGRGGARISLSLLEVAAALQAAPILDRALQQAMGDATGPAAPLGAPIGVFATADGHINLSCVGERMFAGIARALGVQTWLEDPGFATAQQRLERAAEINAETARCLPARSTAEWIAAFAREDVLCGPVQDHAALLADPQAAAIGLFASLDLPALGLTVPVPRLPGEAPPAAPRCVPGCGEHSTAILKEAGLTAAEIAALLDCGVVRQAAA
ncbi:CoA transferase [Belnapia sp. T6]|uniref:CoA transferase n=1 Tax=Belnapia mucosa TaxID=2804532 RepID=A0ABS1V3R5_9PROT|nr:CoA transferase [Belnapia mucosa]MBL6456331.1 CoA transferase [Belnapia mucosa]